MEQKFNKIEVQRMKLEVLEPLMNNITSAIEYHESDIANYEEKVKQLSEENTDPEYKVQNSWEYGVLVTYRAKLAILNEFLPKLENLILTGGTK